MASPERNSTVIRDCRSYLAVCAGAARLALATAADSASSIFEFIFFEFRNPHGTISSIHPETLRSFKSHVSFSVSLAWENFGSQHSCRNFARCDKLASRNIRRIGKSRFLRFRKIDDLPLTAIHAGAHRHGTGMGRRLLCRVTGWLEQKPAGTRGEAERHAWNVPVGTISTVFK